MSTQLDEYTEVTNETADPIFAHIVDRGEDDRHVEAVILEARILGLPLTALCGHVWVPSRDPMKYPPCEKCLEMLPFAMNYRGL